MNRDARRHGFTLLEMLLSLGFLSAITIVMLSWTTVAADSAGAFSAQVNWERSARSVFRMIAEDIACGDSKQPQSRSANEPARLRVRTNEMTIRTRTASGAGEDRSYRLDEGTLRREGDILLENVREFTCTLDEDERWLDVTVTSAQVDKSIARRFRLP